jgi:hypothetical protein
MKFWAVACSLLVLSSLSPHANSSFQSERKVVTVPATIDHDRVIIEAGVSLPDGSIQPVRAWIDNGSPDLKLSQHLATEMRLGIDCNGQDCSASPPQGVVIGGMAIPLTGIKQAKIPLMPDNALWGLAPGLPADITIPSTVLRHYDVLIDFPGHEFTIGMPGTIHFEGSSSKVQIDAENGLIRVPSKIENKKYDLALDLGSSISFLSDELFDKLATAHADWPHMAGAVGPANVWGLPPDETKWKLMRLDRLQYGPLFLTNIAVAALPTAPVDFLQKPTEASDAGLLGAQALLNYRVGLDYAHSMVYFDIGRMSIFPDFDVVGLTLRPEFDGQYTILSVADLDGKPSVPTDSNGAQPGDSLIAVDDIPVRRASMGQVWSMLGGTPGQERKLTVARAGKQFTVMATVQHFLAELPDDNDGRRKSRH